MNRYSEEPEDAYDIFKPTKPQKMNALTPKYTASQTSSTKKNIFSKMKSNKSNNNIN